MGRLTGFFRRSEALVRHPEELLRLLKKAGTKAYARRGELVHVFEDFLLLFRLVKAWVMGEYKEIPRQVVLWAVLAIIYFVSPLDAIPDLFPGGYLDDIAFISFIVKRLRGDLDRFKDWEGTR